MPVYEFHRGIRPLLISIPHAGTEVPASLFERLSPVARELPDTDWYVDQLYAFARELGASIIKANYSRYIVDLNRAADSAALYDSAPTSPVCPTHTFAGEPLYAKGDVPDAREISERVAAYWQPYHDCIVTELARLKAEHGRALLWDAHSIASEIPGLFAGRLPEFNLGTRDGAACPDAVAQALLQTIQSSGGFSSVLNGRFKGGYITKAHGQPAQGVYAVQLELSQRTYMTEQPRGAWNQQQAAPAAACIRSLLTRYLEVAES